MLTHIQQFNILIVFGFSVFTLLGPLSVSAQTIQLDQSFGTGGKVTVGFGDTGLRSSQAFHVFSQPGGRIVTVGAHLSGGQFGTSGIAACGLTPVGLLDSNFGTGGKTLEMNSSDPYWVESLSNGQFLRLIAVWSSPPFVTSGLHRLNSNGSIDGSFAADLNVGANSVPVALTTRSDGKILVLLRGIGGDNSVWVVRLNANGTRDGSFGTNGMLLLNMGRLSRAVTVGFHALPDNRIMLAGYLSTTQSVSGGNVAWAAVLNDSGHYDRRFGLQGVARVSFAPSGIRISKTLLQPDGKIVLVGHTRTATNNQLLLLRLTMRGRGDTSFGQNGIVVAPNTAPNNFDIANSAALMSDGRVVVVGSSGADQASPASFLVARFSAGGTMESHAVTGFTAAHNSFAYGVTIQPDGKLVVAGFTRNPDASADGNLFAIARYTQ